MSTEPIAAPVSTDPLEIKRQRRRAERERKKVKISAVKKQKRFDKKGEKNLKIRAKKKLENEEKKKKLQEDIPKTIFIGRLPAHVTEEILKTAFGKFGKIKLVRFLWKDEEKTTHNGCAWITFDTEKNATAAIQLNGTTLEGGNIRVNLESQKEIIANNDLTVCLKNLSYTSTEETIRSFFSKCGNVTRVSLPTFSDTGYSKGVAFIDFDKKEGVEAAIKLSGTKLDGRDVTILTHNKKEIVPEENYWESESKF
jgi:nucleolin